MSDKHGTKQTYLGGASMIQRKRLWYVEGLNALRHKVGEYFWTASSSEARMEWTLRFGGIPTHWRLEN